MEIDLFSFLSAFSKKAEPKTFRCYFDASFILFLTPLFLKVAKVSAKGA